MFNVVVSKQVRKYLLKQDAVNRRRLGNALLELAENPFSGAVSKSYYYECPPSEIAFVFRAMGSILGRYANVGRTYRVLEFPACG